MCWFQALLEGAGVGASIALPFTASQPNADVHLSLDLKYLNKFCQEQNF